MKRFFLIALFLISSISFAEIKIVTTTTVIYDLVKQIGKDKVKVDFLCRGDQDPHFLEVMPSYMLKLRNADLVFKIGLDLEKWLPQLIDGSRNSKIKIIDLSRNINKLEVPATKPDASQGDIHPYGNPHYWLAPENAKIMINEIYEALAEQSPKDTEYFKKNLDEYISILDKNIKKWKNEIEKIKDKKIITFHSSWIYFTTEFGIKVAGHVEPKPGVPPSPSHNAEIIQLIKSTGIKTILMENYYSDSAPKQIAELTGAKVVKVPVGVYGMDEIDSYVKMIDYIISQIAQRA
jgi:zinc/manganese transport system substrate-binding protein